MFQRFRDWLAAYSITSKTLVCVWFAFTVLYVENEAFHDYVFMLFTRFPRFLQEFVVGFLVPVLMVFSKRAKETRP
jgi:hypothetical protein